MVNSTFNNILTVGLIPLQSVPNTFNVVSLNPAQGRYTRCNIMR